MLHLVFHSTQYIYSIYAYYYLFYPCLTWKFLFLQIFMLEWRKKFVSGFDNASKKNFTEKAQKPSLVKIRGYFPLTDLLNDDHSYLIWNVLCHFKNFISIQLLISSVSRSKKSSPPSYRALQCLIFNTLVSTVTGFVEGITSGVRACASS